MTDKKPQTELKAFKIGDLQTKNKSSKLVPKQSTNKAPPEEKSSAGFPRVEALIEQYDTAAQAKAIFSQTLDTLDAKIAEEKNYKKKTEIIKAKRAFEIALSVVDHLFKVKLELLHNKT